MKSIEEQLTAKLKRWHLLYYWSSGFVDIVEGLIKVFTLGLLKLNWTYRYACFSARQSYEIRVAWRKKHEIN